MIRFFFDIETIPAEPSKRNLIKAISKRKKEDVFEKTALDGNFGRIFCIAYIKEPPKKSSASIISGSEKEILAKFWKLVRNADLLIGHNILDFDLRFIYKRSIVHGVKPTRDLNFARYRSRPIYDTMREWEKWSMGSKTSLDTLSKILGFPTSKDELSGSKVYQAYQDKEYEKIYRYCKKDVELTRKIYYKMNFLKL